MLAFPDKDGDLSAQCDAVFLNELSSALAIIGSIGREMLEDQHGRRSTGTGEKVMVNDSGPHGAPDRAIAEDGCLNGTPDDALVDDDGRTIAPECAMDDSFSS